MPERLRAGIAGHVFHVMNRCWPNELLFASPSAYRAFLRLIAEVHAEHPIPILAFCVMPNHWHFILRPTRDTQITEFIGALSLRHAKRFRKDRGDEGAGAVYPERYLDVRLPSELNVFRCGRYVERNPIRAGLVHRAEDWPASSVSPGADNFIALTPWPGGKPANWLAIVNEEERPRDLAALKAQMYESRKTRRPHA